MNVSSNPDFDAHEEVKFVADEASGLLGVIAIHSTARGPAIGGCRLNQYEAETDAVTDALRLSRGMSFKNAMADLPAGGGKAVLYRVPADHRAAAFAAFGQAVDDLGGRYVTAEDVGTTVSDMLAISTRTKHVAGLPVQPGMAGGDPSPWTALGVFVSIEATIARPLPGARIAVQGLGSVGYRLCRLLSAAGASLIVADVDPAKVANAVREFGAQACSVEAILEQEVELFSPNALGAVLNARTIPLLDCDAVCGGANNQLATAADGEALFARGIRYAPDYVANAGGIINVVAEYLRESDAQVEGRVRQIGERVADILRLSRESRRPPNLIADDMARQRLIPVMAGAHA